MRPIAVVALLALGVAGLGWGWSIGPGGASLIAIALGAFVLGIATLGAMGAWWGSPRDPGSAERAALRTEMEQARAELDAIHASVSHDLRSPISAVLNFLAVLEEDHGKQLDGDGHALLARVRRSANSALTLLDGLARLARVGHKPMAPRVVDVNEIVRRAFATGGPTDRAIDMTVQSPLPRAFGDPELLGIAFSELVHNAVRFTAGRETSVITVGGRSRDDGTVEYWVSDNGVGFDPRYAGKLFHVFERLHSRDQFPGAGAGLAIVRRVAERHGGHVRAEGEPERGATFHLSLPPQPAGGGAS